MHTKTTKHCRIYICGLDRECMEDIGTGQEVSKEPGSGLVHLGSNIVVYVHVHVECAY